MSKASVRFRIASYNTHKCRGIHGGISPDRVIRVIQELEADILCLQEIVDAKGGTGKLDQARKISEAFPQFNVAFGKTRPLRGGRYGNMLLTRFPILNARTHDITKSRREERGVLQCKIEVGKESCASCHNSPLRADLPFSQKNRRGYFEQLLSTSEEISDSIRPLLKMCREQIDRSIRLDSALLRSLERDPLLTDRLRRLRTVPGVGPITALAWALEVGDTSRFHSIKQAISYCGLCSAEKSSADKIMRTPISKQRNKHIQQVLVEAARLAPRYSEELALLYERERQRGNSNRATLAVARKMVAHMLAVERRNTDFVPAGQFQRTAAA